MRADGRGKGFASMGLAGLALAAVIAGLVLTGGPVQARKERRDETRSDDLMAIARQVECLADTSGALPAEVSATEVCPFTGRMADPFTGAAYSYTPLDTRNWRLCAVFETPPTEPRLPMGYPPRDAVGCSVHHLPGDAASPVPDAGHAAP